MYVCICLTHIGAARVGDGVSDKGDYTAMVAAKIVRTGPGRYKGGLVAEGDVASPFLASEPSPESEGWYDE